MTPWNPSNLFQTYPELRLSEAEKQAIQSQKPESGDGKYYVDAVFEGGGVKGTAFLGALRCFADADIHFRKVAGTSAGAITAAMVAAGFSIDELEQEIIGPLDYEGELLSQKTSWLVDKSPSDDLQHFGMLIGRLLVTGKDGQYSTEPFQKWLAKYLQAKLPTFAPFLAAEQDHREWYDKRDLQVVISDISCKEMRVLPKDLTCYGYEPGDFSVVDAVRLSMSIPLFFEPGQLGKSTIVDGGILSNFPLWIYDAKPTRKPCCPTFGFRLVENQPAPASVKGALGIMQAMFATMQVARDSHHIREHDQGRIINIPTHNISATKFDLSTDDKNLLYKSGYEAAKAFLKQWNWQAHLQARGFDKSESQEAQQTVPMMA